MRGAERRGNLVFPISYELRDCFASLAKTAFQTSYETIKLDEANLITAFGQACSYKLFSHKSCIVVPKTSSDEDIGRLDSLGRIFGIGLVLFDPLHPKEPDFSIRVCASREEPDMFYVNKYLKLVEEELFG